MYGIEKARMEDALDEGLPAQSRQFDVEIHDRSAARIGRIIYREAPQTRQYLGNQPIALVARDVEGGEFADPADADAFELIAQARGDVVERDRSEFLEAQFGQRIAGIDRTAAVGLVEREQVELVVEDLQADARAECRGTRARCSSNCSSGRGSRSARWPRPTSPPPNRFELPRLKLPKTELELSYPPPICSDAVLASCTAISRSILSGVRPRRGRDARVREITQRVEPPLRILDLGGRVGLLLLDQQFAPDDLVRGLGVAGDIDAIDQHFAARIDVVGYVDRARRRIDLRARVDVDVGVAAIGVEIRQRQHVMLHRRRRRRPRWA